MANETYSGYKHLVGDHADQTSGLEQACEVLEAMPYRDMQTLLTIMSGVRSTKVSTQSVLNGNRFHEPSPVSPRTLHKVETVIYDSAPDIEFVDLSPLQPFAINTVLAGTNEKNVVSALRQSEVNADSTTALFRLAVQKFSNEPVVTLASNSRVTRAQTFQGETRFLPHFKFFGEASVGLDPTGTRSTELETLSDHLAREAAILDTFSNAPGSKLKEVSIAVGNTLIMEELFELGMINRDEVRKRTIDPKYDVFLEAGLDIPKSIPLDDTHIKSTLRDFGFTKAATQIDRFREVLAERHPELLPRINFDLARIAGIGYYQHLAYKITGIDPEGNLVPLADGGSTNWAEKVASNRKLYSVASGIGTELLAAYFLSD